MTRDRLGCAYLLHEMNDRARLVILVMKQYVPCLLMLLLHLRLIG